MKVGLTIASVIPKPSANPFANTVLPAPREPLSEITEPLTTFFERLNPNCFVSFSL